MVLCIVVYITFFLFTRESAAKKHDLTCSIFIELKTLLISYKLMAMHKIGVLLPVLCLN